MDKNFREFYERTSDRFWDPLQGPIGRDLKIIDLLENGVLEGSILDYGFGSGSLLFELAKQSKVSSLMGADISRKNIDKAKLNIETISKAMPSIANKIKFTVPEDDHLFEVNNNSFDLSICVAVLEHVIDPYVLLDELFRVTKDKGTLICSVPNYAYIKHRIHLLMGKLPITGTNKPVENWRQAGWDGMHLHTFTKTAFEILLRDCGWSNINIFGYGTKYPWISKLRHNYPALFSGELIAICKK